ncbi:MAG TPA: electron transfer flavoprotein subunit alpha/FixB family protein [Ignavibacteriaceae bacterium]|nr:electron transfer flavoprotein subunit alpha/FixB family protein [Ignavibacteriaceae bacterium]
MANKVLVVLEQREKIIKKSGFEALTVAVGLAKQFNTEVEAVIAGGEISNLADVGKYGVSKITHLKSFEFENYSSSGYNDSISDYAKEVNAEFIILPNTAMGKDLAPRLAVRLNAGCIMDSIDYEIKNGEVTLTRPVYAGKALIKVKFKSQIKVFTIRPNVFKAIKNDSGSPSDISVREVTSPNLKTRVTSFKKSDGKLDVAEAEIIVSGGRGLKGPENFHLIEELADSLGAAVGASRAVVDAGWRPHREQVGQTGKTVSPSLYIACGISGAIQHLAGMSTSKFIVAINKDKDAPIFNAADYGIAGDVFEIVPKLTEEIKKLKS